MIPSHWSIHEEYSTEHGIHAYVSDETGRHWEVLVRPVYVPVTVFGVTLLQGWEWLVDGHRPREIGEPMSRDEAWERALRYLVSREP